MQCLLLFVSDLSALFCIGKKTEKTTFFANLFFLLFNSTFRSQHSYRGGAPEIRVPFVYLRGRFLRGASPISVRRGSRELACLQQVVHHKQVGLVSGAALGCSIGTQLKALPGEAAVGINPPLPPDSHPVTCTTIFMVLTIKLCAYMINM